jgi:pyruvate/2-oxoglutarate dehydrogenase complex dihydrolipoamide acyltransferase (E2) component
MSITFTPPPLTDASELTIERYYCAVGDALLAGQPLVMVRSGRFVWDIPTPMSGTLQTILAQPGATVAVGAPLVELQADDIQPEAKPAVVEQRVRATPLARNIAMAHALDLTAISGTGYRGSVTRADVLEVIREQESGIEGQEQGSKEQSTLSQDLPILGNRMLHASISHAPGPTPQISSLPYALTAIEIDATDALATLQAHRARAARRGINLTLTACVATAVVAALDEHRLLNSAWSDDGVIVRGSVHLLVEQALHTNTHAALIPQAAELNLLGLARQMGEAPRSTNGYVPTFAIAERAAPWWSHTQIDGTYAAQLTIGAVQHQPRVITLGQDDHIAVQPTILLTLAYDARVIAQPQADAFLAGVKQRLEHLRSL